jgi:glycosyltransferase involved in cell wall biosynthesis
MELYRLHYPYAQGIATYHGIQYEVDQTTYAAISEMPILESDIYVFSRIRFPEIVDKVLSQNKKLVIDIDDYWKLHKDHPILKAEQSRAENTEYVTNVTGALKRAHLVTTTTQILADKIKEELGVEATVIKNSIPDHSQFDGEKLPHNKVRVGYVGGNHHSPDLAPMQEGMKKLNSDPALVGRYQVVLGGFNTFRATDGNVYANPHFVDYEKILSSDFRALRADTEYIDYLKMCTPMLDHIGYDKAYRRIWNKPLTSYGQMYRQLDVAFAPLIDNTFNACKSELKLIEAGRSRTALIASDVDPYKNHLEHEVNCLAVSPTRHDWYTQVRRMINDKDLREEVADNLHEYVNKNFDHKRETQKLANALSKLK